MDIFDLEEEKLKESSRRRLRLVIVFAVAVAVCGFAVYGFVYGFEAPKNFLNQTAALAIQTFRDAVSSGGNEKLAAEIDLVSGAATGLATISSSSGIGQSAAIYAGAEAGTAQQNSGGEESQKPASAEVLQGTTSANVSESAAGTGSVKTSSSKSTKSASLAVAAVTCGFAAQNEPTRQLIFNEIAWMGSLPRTGETATQAANNEWLELKNISRNDIDLSGWQVADEAGKFKIVFSAGEKLSAGGFYLLERTDDDSVPGIKANKIYSGALANSGMNLRLFGADCAVIDEVNVSSGWPGGDNTTKATMERNIGDFSWHTSATAGGTPKAENSTPAVTTTSSATATVATTAAVTAQASTTASRYYNVGVSMQGGGGTIVSTPAGILCGADCAESYQEGTQVILTATPDNNSSFLGWSGPCNGMGICVFAVNDTTAVVGMFKSLTPVSASAPPPDNGQGGQTTTSTTPTPASGGVVISEIFYDAVGSDAGKEFIELYNRGTAGVNLSGWSLKSGSSSLVSVGSKIEDKVSINGGGFFLVGFSSYNSSPVADVVRSASLPNTTTTITFYDGGGNVVDSVVYPASCSGCILSSGQSYERQPLTADQFVVQSNPNPQNSGN